MEKHTKVKSRKKPLVVKDRWFISKQSLSRAPQKVSQWPISYGHLSVLHTAPIHSCTSPSDLKSTSRPSCQTMYPSLLPCLDMCCFFFFLICPVPWTKQWWQRNSRVYTSLWWPQLRATCGRRESLGSRGTEPQSEHCNVWYSHKYCNSTSVCQCY